MVPLEWQGTASFHLVIWARSCRVDPVDGRLSPYLLWNKRARLWVTFFSLFSFFLSPCRIKGRGGSVGHSSISSPQPALCNVMCCVIVLPDVLIIGDAGGWVQGDDGNRSDAGASGFYCHLLISLFLSTPWQQYSAVVCVCVCCLRWTVIFRPSTSIQLWNPFGASFDLLIFIEL